MNEFMRIFVHLGGLPFVLSSLFYVAACFALVSMCPRKLGYMIMFSATLGHFFGASTWMVYHWGFGVQAAVIYGILISIGFVMCGLDGNGFSSEPIAAEGSADA
jgi:hypothetical protein